MFYLAALAYVFLLIMCFSLCKISSESDKISYEQYESIMPKRNLIIDHDASEEEWAQFLKDVERLIMKEEDNDEIEDAFNQYGSILRGHQDQS